MGEFMAPILWTMIKRIITARLLSKLLVYGAHFLAQRTDNTLDDKMVAAFAESLGVTDYK